MEEMVLDVSSGTWNLIEFDLVPSSHQPTSPLLYAAAQLRIVDGDISGIGVSSRFAGAFWGDVGKYYVFFAEPQPDTDYIATADAGLLRAYVLNDEKAEEFFIITVTDASGTPADADAVNVSIVRAS